MVHIVAVEKATPTHDLTALKHQFADPGARLVSRGAVQSAWDLGFSVDQMMTVVHDLRTGDFIKSATQHSPPDHQIWHDTYNIYWLVFAEDDDEGDRFYLYLKFAGRKHEPVTLTSFKESLDV